MTQLYCIYDPEGKAIPKSIRPNEHEPWNSVCFPDQRIDLRVRGYACKPVQIANLEEEVVISKDEYEGWIDHQVTKDRRIRDLEAENHQLKIDFDVARSMIIPAGEL